MSTIGVEYLQTVIRRFKAYKQLGDKTFEQLSEEQIHFTPNATSNSICTIVQHMSGNMLSRWTNFLTEDGEKDWRRRDEEFEVHTHTKAQVIALWEKGWNCLLDTLASLKEDDLLKTIYIRKEPLSVIDAVNRQLAHYPYHVGQIVYIGKLVMSEQWKSLSIERGKSEEFNNSDVVKDPAKLMK